MAQVAELEGRKAALIVASEFARAAELQVGLGDLKAVGGFFQHFEAVIGLVGCAGSEKNAVAVMLAPPNAAT